MTAEGPDRLEVTAVAGIGEVAAGADLASLLVDAVELADGDIAVVTSKVVSKAEGRVLRDARDSAVLAETDRVVARRGDTLIVRTTHGLTMAAAGVDASNTARGTVVPLPRDPDASARRIREGLRAGTGRNVAVVVSDTAGRAWRTGQTDLAVGAAGIEVLADLQGRRDPYGNTLQVTAPAVADEVAAAADLVKGKLSGRPMAVVRGLGALVLPPGQHGTGAAALLRPESQDLFGYGARDAVLVAVGAASPPGRSEPDGGRGFGAPAPPGELAAALRAVTAGDGTVEAGPAGLVVRSSTADARAAGRLEARVAALAVAHRWTVTWSPALDSATLRPISP